jgi:hypothetical protein
MPNEPIRAAVILLRAFSGSERDRGPSRCATTCRAEQIPSRGLAQFRACAFSFCPVRVAATPSAKVLSMSSIDVEAP